METYYQTLADKREVGITLYSLAEYEADGGEYDDSGNDGDYWAPEERDFLCAATVAGVECQADLEDVGIPRESYWWDSVTDYYLLRQWPADAPLAARSNVS